MIRLIIRKEIQDNLLNARFIAASVVSVLLILTSVIVLTRSYEERLQEHRTAAARQDEFIDRFGHLNRIQWMSDQGRAPSQFQALVLGINTEGREENFSSNPVPALLPQIDFVTIVTIIMSLMAILFSYNTLCGEREAGLLRLMLATGGSRSGLVFGKFIGGNLSLLVPFTVGVIAGLLFLVTSPGVIVTRTDIYVFLLLLLAAWLLISSFYALGLLVSSRAHTSGQAVLSSLSAWTMFVLLIPNISPFLAARIYPTPSVAKTEKDIRWITSDERDEIVRQRGRELLQGEYADIAGIVQLTPNERQAAIDRDPRLRDRYTMYVRAWDEMLGRVNAEQKAKGDKIDNVEKQRAKNQEQFAIVFASLSPISSFIFAATDLTETGIQGEDRWERFKGQYLADVYAFGQARFDRAREHNPAFDYNDSLDLRDRPRFHDVPATLGERMAMTLLRFGLLALFNLLFLAAAIVSFYRYDVR